MSVLGPSCVFCYAKPDGRQCCQAAFRAQSPVPGAQFERIPVDDRDVSGRARKVRLFLCRVPESPAAAAAEHAAHGLPFLGDVEPL